MSNEEDFGPLMFSALVDSALVDLLKRWDGKRVGFLVDADDATVVGFCLPEYAAGILEKLLLVLREEGLSPTFSTRCGSASQVARVADQLRAAGPRDRMRLLVLGWGTCRLYEVDPPQSSAAARSPNAEGASSFVVYGPSSSVADCGSPEGAGQRVRAALAALHARGYRAIEFERLESTIATRWEDIAALTLAIARARAELATLLATPEGEQAEALLDVLARLTARRSTDPWNALGGSA